MTRILIADDHDVVRSGLRAILEAQPGWEVVGEAHDGKMAVSMAAEHEPDVAIVDYSLPVMNGVEVTRQICSRKPKVEVLMFTMHDSDKVAGEAFKAGARAFLLKSDAKKYLIDAVNSLIVHKPYFTGRLSEKMLESFLSLRGQEPTTTLTPREKVVVQLIAEGNSNKQIGSILNVSVKTVETQRASAMRKLQVTSTAGLVRYAIRNKLVEP